MFSLYLVIGILACAAVSFIATDLDPVKNEASVEQVLKKLLTFRRLR